MMNNSENIIVKNKLINNSFLDVAKSFVRFLLTLKLCFALSEYSLIN